MLSGSWLMASVSLLLLLSLVIPSSAMAEEGNYTADWESLDSRPLPTWYDEAKIGIFMHFGVYAVPGLESEWFWLQSIRNESDGDRRCAAYLRDYFPPRFTYQDFGPQLTMEFFEPDRWADLVFASGAKYFVITSKHHDGFANWKSSFNFGWNSMDVGPRRDVLAELKNSFDNRHPHIKFGLYYSLFEWFHPLYVQDRENNFETQNYVDQKMIPEIKQIINTFEPHVLWADGDWETRPPYWRSEEILAWMFNEAPTKDTIVTNDRWGIGTAKKHGSFWSGPDRFSPGTLQPHKWENAMTMDSESWGYRRNIYWEQMLSMHDIITEVAKTVSCGGNILINVGPTKEGTIAPVFEERLIALGKWLELNGEAIYSTKAWSFQNDSINSNVWYTAKEKVVYAINLEWPENDVMSVGAPRVSEKTRFRMLGDDQQLDFELEDDRVNIKFPSMSTLRRKLGTAFDWAYVIEMTNLDNGDNELRDQIDKPVTLHLLN